MKITPDMVLRRMDDIHVDIKSIQSIAISVNGSTRGFPNSALVLLNIFAKPQSVKDAIDTMQLKGTEQWVVTMNTIRSLYDLGVLGEHEQHKNLPDKVQTSFGAIPIHIHMLNDRTRTDWFINAINKTVKPGNVVLDIGTGTGVLAIAAARAGALRVYAIESGAMADAAAEIIAQSGFADRITLLRGWSYELDLPEKADILVSEIIGNDPFAEKVLSTFSDARRRFLNPGARIIPGKIQVYGLPTTLSEDVLKGRLQEKHLASWKDWYGIDFSALKRHETPVKNPVSGFKTEKAKLLPSAGQEFLIYETDFHHTGDTAISREFTTVIEQPFNAILMYFVIEHGGVELTNNPQRAGADNHWLTPVWYFGDKLSKKPAGETLHLKFSYGSLGGSELTICDPVNK